MNGGKAEMHRWLVGLKSSKVAAERAIFAHMFVRLLPKPLKKDKPL